MPIFYSKKEKGSKPYPNVKFRTNKKNPNPGSFFARLCIWFTRM